MDKNEPEIIAENAQDHQSEKPSPASDNEAALVTIMGTLGFLIFSFPIGLALKTPPLATFKLSIGAIVWGLLAVIPMLAIVLTLQKSSHPSVIKFYDQVSEYFAKIGFKITPLRILLLSLGAGIGEEMLFRGAIQAGLTNYLPIAAAIFITSLVFGLLHAINKIYVALAGFISVYFGVLFVVTDNIAIPIITHTVYDIIAFFYVREMVEKWHLKNSDQDQAS